MLWRITVLLWSSVGFYFYLRGGKELQKAIEEAEEYSEDVPIDGSPTTSVDEHPESDHPERERVAAQE